MNALIIIGITIACGIPMLWIVLILACLAERNQDGERVYSPTLVKARGRKS